MNTHQHTMAGHKTASTTVTSIDQPKETTSRPHTDHYTSPGSQTRPTASPLSDASHNKKNQVESIVFQSRSQILTERLRGCANSDILTLYDGRDSGSVI